MLAARSRPTDWCSRVYVEWGTLVKREREAANSVPLGRIRTASEGALCVPARTSCPCVTKASGV